MTPRVCVLTDSDSYVKWGAALVGQLPPDWGEVRFLIADGSAEPSPRQVAEALAGTIVDPDDVERVGLERLRAILRTERPDVLILAARGLTVQSAIELAVSSGPDRPVLVSGLPGIALPVLPYGLGFRRSVDLFIVHSHREVRAFTEASRSLGIPHRFALARLPFLRSGSPGPTEVDRPQPHRDRIIFAAQSLVPESRAERQALLEQLVRTARAHRELTVVIKIRGTSGESQTHADQHPYPDLLAHIHDVPDNLVVESGPMSAHLERAVGLVTVSSTALLEAIAAGVPTLALTDFGVDARQINLVFTESGLLHDSSELVAGRFHHPDPDWMRDNYFHDPSDDTWISEIETLLAARAAGKLPPYARAAEGLRHQVTMFFYRHQAFTTNKHPAVRLLERCVVSMALRVSRSPWIVSRRFKPARVAPMGDVSPAGGESRT